MKITKQKKKIEKIEEPKQYPVLLLIGVLICLASFIIGGLFYEAGGHTQFKYILQGRIDELPDGTIKETMQELYGLIKSETVAYSGNNLPTLYLDIPFENLQIIQQKRDEALESGILLASDADYVSATVRYNDSAPIDIELRLKGDWTDHLKGEKWSYRIHIKDDAAIEGMTRFSIQAPETRNFIYEWAYHKTLMREGILAPRYFFINVIENGENKGVFAMEESFYTELIESQQRRSGIIVRYNEDDMWQNWANFFSYGAEDLRTTSGSSGYFMAAGIQSANISGFGMGKIVDDPVLLAEYRTAQGMLRDYQIGEVSASEVFDIDKMGKFIAISELWGAGHALAWHNLRFYYNPVTNLLEPIAFDGIAMSEPYASMDLYESFGESNFLTRDPAISDAFYMASKEYFNDTYLTTLNNEMETDIAYYSLALSKEYDYDIGIDWIYPEKRIKLMNEDIYSDMPVSVDVEFPENDSSEILITIESSYFLPLRIMDISLDGRIIELDNTTENLSIPSIKYGVPGKRTITIVLPETYNLSITTPKTMQLKLSPLVDYENIFNIDLIL